MPNPFETIRTINPQNWVRSSELINIDPDLMTVKVNGETLTLVHDAPIFGDMTSAKYDFHCIRVFWDDREFVTLTRFGDDTNWSCDASGISRDAADPFELAAIMACNLI